MKGSAIREKLHNGERTYGMHIASLMNPVAATMAAAKMEMDFAFICTEHMPIDRTEVSRLCHLYSAHGVSPIVRVPCPDAAAIGMVLDAGAEGIVVPYVETVDEVKMASAAIRYRPLKGKLLKDALTDPSKLPEETHTFLKGFNQNNYLIIGVESVPAMESLEELITCAEVDGVFLGPHDITTSMGIPEDYANPRFLDAVEDVILRCRKHSVGVGLHTQLLSLEDRTLKRFLNAGMNWILNGADITVMLDAMNAQLRTLRAIPSSQQTTCVK